MKHIVSAAVLSLIALFASISSASDTPADILIASEAWEDCTNEDGTGLYWEIFKEVFGAAGVTVKHQIRSYSGAVKLLEEQKVDAVVGAYEEEVEGALYPKRPFGADLVAVVFKESTVPRWNKEDSLKGKNVGWIKGYSYDEYLTVPVEKFEFDQRGDALKVLDKGRIDFFMDAYEDLLNAKESGLIPPQGYRFEKLLQLNLFIVFTDTDNGKKYRDIFDQKFEELMQSGKIKALYEKWASSGITYPF